MSGQLSEFRIAQRPICLAILCLYQYTAYPDADGSVHGVVDLPSASGATNIVFSLGDILHVEEMGALPSGLSAFLGDSARTC